MSQLYFMKVPVANFFRDVPPVLATRFAASDSSYLPPPPRLFLSLLSATTIPSFRTVVRKFPPFDTTYGHPVLFSPHFPLASPGLRRFAFLFFSPIFLNDCLISVCEPPPFTLLRLLFFLNERDSPLRMQVIVPLTSSPSSYFAPLL